MTARGPSEDELRRRLEAAAPLLEETRARYRALVPALKAWGWKGRLRGLADVAREVARTDAEVRGALERALRRAKSEAWPDGPVRALLDELSAQRDALRLVLTRRGAEAAEVGAQLKQVLALVVGVPRHVPLAEREAAAQEALGLEPELVPELQRFGGVVEKLFGRPLQRAQRLPLNLDELDALRAAWDEGLATLARGWDAVRAIDLSGGVERELLKRARRAPRGTRTGLPGPKALVHAAFWRDAAEARVEAVVDERFAPVEVTEAERWPLLRWLLARETDGAARLEPQTPRAALLMLAHELTASPEGRAKLVGGREQVRRWAEAADALEGEPDWQRVRDGLRALSARTFRPSLPPLYRVGQKTPKPTLPTRLAEFFAEADGVP